jgi:hypothetical protein
MSPLPIPTHPPTLGSRGNQYIIKSQLDFEGNTLKTNDRYKNKVANPRAQISRSCSLGLTFHTACIRRSAYCSTSHQPILTYARNRICTNPKSVLHPKQHQKTLYNRTINSLHLATKQSNLSRLSTPAPVLTYPVSLAIT